MSIKQFKSYKIFTGVSVYKNEENSKFYHVRIWIPSQKKYKVISTGVTSLIDSKEIGIQEYLKLKNSGELNPIPENKKFRYWCEEYIKYKRDLRGTKKENLKIEEGRLLSENTGLCSVFGNIHVEEINNSHLTKFFEQRSENSRLDKKIRVIGNNSKNKYLYILKSVLRYTFSQNGISRVPEFLKHDMKKRDNPRPSFHFDEPNNEYSNLLKSITKHIQSNTVVRYTPINDELYNLVIFIVHGFLRPTVSELFSIKYKDINIRKNPSCLEIRVTNGKTGFRIVNSTEWLVDIFKKMKDKDKDHKPDDYIFMKEHTNRNYVRDVFQRQFKHVLESSKLQHDEYGQKRSLYSLRHLSIQMRLVKSGGKINLLWFSQNCGTSVEMIQRFYSSYLPNNKEVIRNLQSFSD